MLHCYTSEHQTPLQIEAYENLHDWGCYWSWECSCTQHVWQVAITVAAEWWAFGCVGADIFSTLQGFHPLFKTVESKTCQVYIQEGLKKRVGYSVFLQKWLEGYFEKSHVNRTGGESTIQTFQHNSQIEAQFWVGSVSWPMYYLINYYLTVWYQYWSIIQSRFEKFIRHNFGQLQQLSPDVTSWRRCSSGSKCFQPAIHGWQKMGFEICGFHVMFPESPKLRHVFHTWFRDGFYVQSEVWWCFFICFHLDRCTTSVSKWLTFPPLQQCRGQSSWGVAVTSHF